MGRETQAESALPRVNFEHRDSEIFYFNDLLIWNCILVSENTA